LCLAAVGAASFACSFPAPSPPPAEFIIATPDSTFWVNSTPTGIRVRGVPMTLTRYGGAYHEVYVADIDRSYDNAIFTGERVYQRDILRNDSTLVYDDTTVVRAARLYQHTHPTARPLAADDDTPEDPSVVVRGETDLIDVRGPFVLIQHRASVEHIAGEQYDTVDAAIDLRSARAAPISAMSKDPIVHDSSAATSLPYTWHRAEFDLVARTDTTSGVVLLHIRDKRSRSWPVLTTHGAPRIYWLDTPPVDARTRAALSHAFNEAFGYDDDLSYVRYVVPRARRTMIISSVLSRYVRSHSPTGHHQPHRSRNRA